MDTFAWLKASLLMKAGWKFVSVVSGEQFVVITTGTLMMPELCAGSWAFLLMHLVQVYSAV